MYEMHVIDKFAAFYIREKIVLVNITKIKRLGIKDVLQYYAPLRRSITLHMSVGLQVGMSVSLYLGLCN